MTLAEYCLKLLADAAPVKDLVVDRVYTDVLPQKPKLPCVLLEFIASKRDGTLDGATDPDETQLRATSIASSRREAMRVGARVLAALDEHAGARDGLEVQGIFFESAEWGIDTELTEFHLAQDYTVIASGATE